MSEKYNVYLISDSTGETLDRIFYRLNHNLQILIIIKKNLYLLTEQQIDKIVKETASLNNSIILYTIVVQTSKIFSN